MAETSDVDWRPDLETAYATSEDIGLPWPDDYTKDSLDMVNDLRCRVRLGIAASD